MLLAPSLCLIEYMNLAAFFNIGNNILGFLLNGKRSPHSFTRGQQMDAIKTLKDW